MNLPVGFPSDFLIEDVQSLPDIRSLAIDKVGIKSIRHPSKVKAKTGEVQPTVAMFNMYVHLPHNVKGTHMSRFVEILNTNECEISMENFETILREMVKRLEAESGYIEMTLYAYDNPEFVAEMVSDITAQLGRHASIEAYSIECANFESIPNPSAYAVMHGERMS